MIARIRDPIKAVLMDVDMPIMDGITVKTGNRLGHLDNIKSLEG